MVNTHRFLHQVALAFTLLIGYRTTTFVASIDCYVCTSISNSNPDCDEPFTSNINRFLIPHCRTYGDSIEEGSISANLCVRIEGILGTSPSHPSLPLNTDFNPNRTVIMRTCRFDDTETRTDSSCSRFQFGPSILSGCLHFCTENACNGPTQKPTQPEATPFSLLLDEGYDDTIEGSAYY